MAHTTQHFFQAPGDNVEVAIPQPGDILRANAVGRWQAFAGEIDGTAAVPTATTLSQGFITFRVVSGVLIAYVNDAGVIKQLALGEPG